MTPYIAGALALLLCVLPCLWLLWRSSPLDGVIALVMAGALTSLSLLLLAEGTQRAGLLDLAVVLALLSLGAGLVFTRALERWL